jgi:hypothetical protein
MARLWHHSRLNRGVKAALEAWQRRRWYARAKDNAAFLAFDPSCILNHLLSVPQIVGDPTESRSPADSHLPHAIGPVFVAFKIVALSHPVIDTPVEQGGDIGWIDRSCLHPDRTDDVRNGVSHKDTLAAAVCPFLGHDDPVGRQSELNAGSIVMINTIFECSHGLGLGDRGFGDLSLDR